MVSQVAPENLPAIAVLTGCKPLASRLFQQDNPPFWQIVMKKGIALLLYLYAAANLLAQTPEVELRAGLVITKSCRIKPQTYVLAAKAEVAPGDPYQPVIAIVGDDIEVDFQQAELRSPAAPERPDRFTGLAIEVRGKNVVLKNARVHGYKVGLLAHHSPGLKVENCDFSYNYRPRLRSSREREDFSDWLSYHQNDRNEWLRYGAGIYLDSCPNATVRDCRITGNQNALLMTRCDDGLFYNNNFSFNSGLGIGLYRSNRNRVMHNRLDWNVRGYSHGFYQRGQDSAAILCYEQSSNNVFAFNSATHSGDGFFLWAGQTTMDTGEGGCNDNLIFGNNFSHAATNGVEATFSRNRIQGNLIRECTYGVWAGYSYETTVFGNLITNCQTGVAIEHGQNNTIRLNLFDSDSIAVHFWERDKQPDDWAYAQKRDVRSRDAVIDRNAFLRCAVPLKIASSKNISVNGENLFSGFQTLLETPKPNEGLKFLRNDLYGSREQMEQTWQHPELSASRKLNFSYPEQQPLNPYKPLEIQQWEIDEPDSLPGGMNTALPPDVPTGRQHILVDEWGPYDFQRPYVIINSALETPRGDKAYILRLLGPPGVWKLVQQRGKFTVSKTSGTLPGYLNVSPAPGEEEDFWLEFEYKGLRPIVDAFGRSIPAGQPYRFVFQRYDKKMNWRVQWFNAADEQWNALLTRTPDATPVEEMDGLKVVAEKTVKDLYFAWWGAPVEGARADRFVTVATSTAALPPGRYRIELTSDDGARLYVDGRCLIDRWDIHEPTTDEVEIELGGEHTFRIEHFDAGGFSTLDFRLRPVR